MEGYGELPFSARLVAMFMHALVERAGFHVGKISNRSSRLLLLDKDFLDF